MADDHAHGNNAGAGAIVRLSGRYSATIGAGESQRVSVGTHAARHPAARAISALTTCRHCGTSRTPVRRLPIQHIAELRRRLPQLQIFSMYGLTECKRVAYLPPEEIDLRPGSVGKAMPNTEAYVVNEQGQRAAPGETGQLVVRGSHVMQGYWRDPEASARVLKPDGLPGSRILCTGDVFRTDEDGYLYFVGRTDDIIKSRGEKVSPREVEDVIHRHDGVVEAAVVGAADPVLGQAIHAFVTVRDGGSLDAAAVRAHCARHLESFMVPTHVEIRTDLPRTAVGKIDRKKLEAEAMQRTCLRR